MNQLVRSSLFFAATVFAFIAIVVLKRNTGIVVIPEPWDLIVLKGAVLAGLANFFWTALGTGKRIVSISNYGRGVARLKRGARILLSGLGGMLVMLSTGAILEGWPPTAWQVFLSGGHGALGFYLVCLGVLSKVEFTDSELNATNGWFIMKSHAWSDILKIDADQGQWLLRFQNTGTAKISKYYEGVGQIIDRAEEALNNA